MCALFFRRKIALIDIIVMVEWNLKKQLSIYQKKKK